MTGDDPEGEPEGWIYELLSDIRDGVAAIRRQQDTLARAHVDLLRALADADSLADVDADAVRSVDAVDAADGVRVHLTPRERAAARRAGDSPREYVGRALALRFETDGDDEVLGTMDGDGGRCPVCGEPAARRVSVDADDVERLQPCGHDVPAEISFVRDLEASDYGDGDDGGAGDGDADGGGSEPEA